MDIYKERFTSLQHEILRFLFVNPTKAFNQRQLALNLQVSPTAISKSLEHLKKESLITAEKEKEGKRIAIKLNRDNESTFYLKRIENLRGIYESGLLSFLSEKFPLSTIILFGSYSLGEDIERSDIDIAIIGKEKPLELDEYEKTLKREINIQFYSSLKNIETHLKNNIINGITLKGGVNLT